MDYSEIRRRTRQIRVGRAKIGGDAPLTVQSMANADPHDGAAVSGQVRELAERGCDIVRIAVPDLEAAEAVTRIKTDNPVVPLVADIHFDYRIALRCAELGVDAIRIDPGNIGEEEHVRAVADACRARGIPIRVGVNSGSLERRLRERYGAVTPEALAESAVYEVGLLEHCGFFDVAVSVKASTVRGTVLANRLFSQRCDCPLHIGVTEAGTAGMGIVKSSAAIGTLLNEGIGDTLRVSLTADPAQEVDAGIAILRALGLRGGVDIVSCPTCGRTKIDLIRLVKEFERRAPAEVADYARRRCRVAIMGCAVNGPGEAREADIGIAGGSGEAVLIVGGNIAGKLPEGDVIGALISEINRRKIGL